MFEPIDYWNRNEDMELIEVELTLLLILLLANVPLALPRGVVTSGNGSCLLLCLPKQPSQKCKLHLLILQ